MSKVMSYGVPNSSLTDNFVDRIQERNAFFNVVDRISSGMPYSNNLFEWHGPPGIGKTTLVRMLNSECEKRNIPRHLIDFKEIKPSQLKEYTFNPITLFDEIANSPLQYNIDTTGIFEKSRSFQQTTFPTEGLCVAYAHMTERERAYSSEEWLTGMHEVLSVLMESISALPTGPGPGEFRPFVLFIDHVDEADKLLADWIEEFLVKPLVQSKRCVVVWTARHAWKWKRPEIRWDRKSEELRAFTEDEVKEQLALSSRIKKDNGNLIEQLFKNVHTMTGGHPYVGAIVIEQMDRWQDVTVDILKKHEADLYQQINKEFFQAYAFKDLSQEQRTALELCSMVRLIDITTLQHILQDCAGREYKEWQRGQFDQLLLELRKTFLLKWGKNGWTLEPNIRYLMRNYYLSCARDTFKKVNETALKIYQDWLSRYVDNRKQFLIEEIYHHISLKQANLEEVDIVSLLDQRLEEYPSEVQHDTDSWRHVLEQLGSEIEHDEEFIRLIGEYSVRSLTSPIRKRIIYLSK